MISIVLGGMKHCGKSTHGRALAGKLGCEFADTDTLLEELYRERTGEALSVREIYRKRGGDFFRRFEADIISILAAAKPRDRVIALGGGVPANGFVKEDDLRALGRFVYIAIDGETAFRRVVSGGLPPFLENASDPRRAFEELYRERDAFYRKYASDIIAVDGDEEKTAVTAKILNLDGIIK